jgi:DNA-binding transcriptional MerR regulator
MSWTIAELTERVAVAVARAGLGGKSPDERAIRYYTTLGLLERARLRGRTAYYGARHLAQIVAIKRLQADGASLAEIQQVLPTLADGELSALTGVELVARAMPTARRDFWRAPALESIAATDAIEAPVATDAIDPPAASSAALADRDAPPIVSTFVAEQRLELMPGVHLTIAARRTPTDGDADALRAAAVDLLAELVRRHLVNPSPPSRTP